MKNNTNIHSSYWLDLKSYSEYDNVIKLSIIQKTITNFVNILTNGKSVDCTFLENTSNTKNSKKKNVKNGVSTKETIFISADLDNVDLIVGIALHEATHIVRSDFEYRTKFKDEIIKYLINLNYQQKVIFDILFHALVNFIEDRACDFEQLQLSPGYIGYYNALYDDCFRTKSISNQLQNKMTKKEHINMYMFRIINMMNKDSNRFALKGLDEIYKIIDIDNIGRLKTTSDSVNIAWKIYNVLLKYCDVFQYTQNDEEINKILDRQIKILSHQFDKKKLNSSTKQEVDNISQLKLEKKQSKFNSKLITTFVFNDLSHNRISSNKSISPENLQAITKGLILSNKLKEKLQLRNSIKETIFNKKPTGKLDKKQLYSSTFNDNIFYTKHIEQHGDAYIHFSIDASSSMQRSWNKVIIILISLIKSFKPFPDIKVIVSFRTSFIYKEEIYPVVYIVFDSHKSQLESFIRFLKFYNPNGLTPDGLCFNSILNKIEKESKNKKSYFVNISDGLPYFKNKDIGYHDELAEDHTRIEIGKIKKAGLDIMSYYVGGETKDKKLESRFKKIYGKNSEIIYDLNNPIKIINSVNNLFL